MKLQTHIYLIFFPLFNKDNSVSRVHRVGPGPKIFLWVEPEPKNFVADVVWLRVRLNYYKIAGRIL